jgi:hypothetical protein
MHDVSMRGNLISTEISQSSDQVISMSFPRFIETEASLSKFR